MYQLIDSRAPILQVRMNGVSEDLNRHEFANNLLDRMENLNGLGLAANQCGLEERAFAMYSDYSYKTTIVCFNPTITWQSEETSTSPLEGCLSWPGLYLKIRRPIAIKVEYENVDGENVKNHFDGLEARIFQHEFDHLDGIDFTKRANRVVLNMALKKRAKKMRKLKSERRS